MMATQPNSMMNDDARDEKRIAALLAALSAEIDAQTEHAALLTTQGDALKLCDRLAYALLHERHERLLTEAEERSFHFKRLVGQSGEAGSLREEIEEWPESDRKKGLELSGSLRTVADEVSELSERNSQLIRGELNLIVFQMNFILSAAQQDTSYASTGVNRTFQASRLLNSVA